MAIIVGIPRETLPGERRVALTPRACDGLAKSGIEFIVEKGAGAEAGYPDSEYATRKIKVGSRDEVFAGAAIIAQVRTPGANPEAGRADIARYRKGQLIVGLGEPLTAHQETAALAATGVTYFALELVPRITRAQSMDVIFDGKHCRLQGGLDGRFRPSEDAAHDDHRSGNNLAG